MTTHVLIGSNTIRDYEGLAPLSALVWRDRIGFHPIVMKVGDWEKEPRSRVSLKAIRDLGIDFVHVEPMEGHETGRTAQQCRELAGCLHLGEDDWAMPTDADLWPIREAYYQQHQTKPGRITCYYSNGDHYQTIPTCHVTMQVKKWRELYGVKAGDDITAACLRNFNEWFPTRRFWKNDPNFAMWMADQEIVTVKVLACPEGYERIERYGHPPVDRLDRGNWVPEYDLASYVDAHLIRPADDPKNWELVGALFRKLLPQHADWADRYIAEYWRSYNP